MKKNNQPLVSIIMTAYNAGGFITEAIQSALDQTYKNFELIIVDDASTDATWDIIQTFAKLDTRIRPFRMKYNAGPSICSNFATPKAKGKYVARMDADDISYPHRLEKQVAFMESHPEVILSAGQCDVIDESGVIVGKKSFPLTHEKIVEALCMMNPIAHPTWIIRTSVFTNLEIYYHKKYFVSHDLKIVFQLLQHGRLANLKDTLIKYRYRPNSITHKDPKHVFWETVEIRNWAMLKNGYKPTIKGLAIHIGQVAMVPLIPNRLIVTLFIFWRVRPMRKMKRALRMTTVQSYRVAVGAITGLAALFLFDKKM